MIIKVLWFGIKKQIQKGFKKIKSHITELTSQSLNNRVLIEDNKKEILKFVSKSEIKLMIENAILKSKAVQFAPNSGQKSEPKAELIKESNFERVMVKKAKKTRPDMLKTAIRGLTAKGLRTTDMFNIIVLEKKMCGKTQFYHYLSLIKSEVRPELRPELRTKH